MNSCILMAEIVQEPQLRYTTDQTALAEMLVQFPGLRGEDPPATLKVVGWGNLAQEIQQRYHQGDRVIIEGRLSMNTVEREGFKEKRAELTVQRMHPISDVSSASAQSAESRNVAFGGSVPSRAPGGTSVNTTTGIPADAYTPEKVEHRASAATMSQSDPEKSAPQITKPQVPNYSVSMTDADVDDIPF